MAPRAIWRGRLSLGELTCAVALYAAASTSEPTSFNIVNRRTGNRVRREYVDAETGESFEREEGYEIARNRHAILEPEEVAAALPAGDKTLSIESFIPCAEVDTTYFDKPYYLTPGAKAEGRAIEKPKPRREAEVVDLMQALRESAAAQPKRSPRKGSALRRKAG